MVPPSSSPEKNVRGRFTQSSYVPYAAISKLELLFCSAVYIPCLSYGIYNIAQLSKAFRQEGPQLLDEGILLGSHRDVGDTEWDAFANTFPVFIPCCLVNAFISWLLSVTGWLKFRRWSAMCVGIVTLVIVAGLYNASIIMAMAFVTYVGMYLFHPMLFAWLMGIVIMWKPLRFNRIDDGFLSYLAGGAFARSFAYWCNSWNVMRFVSFGSEWYWHQQKPSEKHELGFDFPDFFSFCFYSPTLFGPIISYPDFYKQVIVSKSSKPGGGRSIGVSFSFKEFVRQLIVVCFWTLLMLLANEFLYIHFLNSSVSAVSLLNGFGATAYTWLHGQHFQAKYMVLYGVPWLMANLDLGMCLLPLPVFISRVYLYSEMWKKFDTGLYDFMKRYIYVPMGGSSQFLLSTTATFTFVFAWHGLNQAIFIWSVVNLIQVVTEVYIRYWAADSSSFLSKSVRCQMSPIWWRRLTAFICAISFVVSISVISIFLMGREVGEFVTYWIAANTNINSFMLMLCSYCWVQTVFSWENWKNGCPL